MRAELIVAIDGPSGSGKSSASRLVAESLGLRYLDTGALYRAIALAVLRSGIDPWDASAVSKILDESKIEISTDPSPALVSLQGEDVSAEIRSLAVTNVVSAVASHEEVRRTITDLARAVIGKGGIVVEGRDVGSTIAPEAQVKIFLTANSEIRAERRSIEISASLTSARDSILLRDEIDSNRKIAPLVELPDAIVIDASTMNLQEVVDVIGDAIKKVVK
jgi:CMP/dCMP kinase